MIDWEHACVVVTGAGRGIGRAVTIACLRRGARVIGCARSDQELATIPDEVDGECAARFEWIALDIRDEQAVKGLIARAGDTIDLLINNASVLGPVAPLTQIDAQTWRETVAINVDGTFLVTKYAIPSLRRATHPCVLYLSSSVGREARAQWGPYCVSKFGVEALSGILAQEEPSIRVASINPGATATAMRAEARPLEDPATLPPARQIAETLVWLADHLRTEQSGSQWSSREMFELID